MKKVLGVVAVGVMSLGLLVACGSEDAYKEPTDVVAPPKVNTPEEPEVAPEEAVEEPEAVVDNSEAEQAMLAEFEASFSDSSIIEFKEADKMYVITPTDSGVAEELVMMMNGEMSKDAWYELVDSTIVVSNRIVDEVGDGYSIAMTNPASHDKYILIVMDGVVLYEMFEEDSVY